ncbi:MAG: glycosyltransferase family 4 protein [Burkholderiales bacterium]|nr:glycosyltransferase family 4 protein [Burkholderiales bacterium]
MKVGILGEGFVDWGGGIDFLRGISTALHFADPAIEQHVLIPSKGLHVALQDVRERVKQFLGRPTHAAHRPKWEHVERTFSETGARLHAIDLGTAALARASRRLGLDVLLPAIAPLSDKVGVPWVGYLFDFQHKRLPHFFSDVETTARDAAFERMLRSATAVIVNARDVANDVRHFYPDSRARLFALPFSAAPGDDWFDRDVADTAHRHGVQFPWFVVCNQFWKHKDHETAFKAFAELARRHADVSLVCTGATSDYRHPNHFDELMAYAKREGIADRIRVLGLIPKLDQVALIRGAVALVQPTLFEGGPGGGAVSDALSVGTPAIVSDIAVNREIDEPAVTWFEASNAKALADRMEEALQRGAGGRDDRAELLRRGRERRVAVGSRLLEAVEFARGQAPSPR